MNKKILVLSILFLLVSIGLHISKLFISNSYDLHYQYVNVKDIAMVSVATKKEKSSHTVSLLEKIDGWYLNTPEKEEDKIVFEAVALPKNKNSKEEKAPEFSWHLPTEKGVITQYPSYYHAAYDITSPRGTSEVIFPVANGIISGIYIDGAGGLTLTILHENNGVKYTSQYIHMWRYADGLYVGKPVTINDALGLMGSTGYSTGTHLHIAVVDCALFDPGDSRCSDLGAFSRYAKSKVASGYLGLGSYINVPYRWNHRDGSL